MLYTDNAAVKILKRKLVCIIEDPRTHSWTRTSGIALIFITGQRINFESNSCCSASGKVIAFGTHHVFISCMLYRASYVGYNSTDPHYIDKLLTNFIKGIHKVCITYEGVG